MQKNRIALAVTLSLALPAGAQTASAELPTLDTVVVSGSRSASKLSETPVAIGSVNRASWEQDKPKSVGEIINRIPGVWWNDLGNEQHSMGIRQPISTNAVYQYLEDGIPIRPLGVFNHNALNETNMNSAGGVEVVKGAASSLYGSNAVGGAVNFLSEKPSRSATGTVGLRYDNTNKFTRVDTGASNTWGDLGLRFSHYSAERAHDNWQQYSGGTKDAFSLRGDYDLSATSVLRASVVQTDLQTDMTGSLLETDYRNNPGKSINTFSYRKDKATRANIAWEGETTEGGISTFTLFSRGNDHGQLPSYTMRNCSGSNATCTGTINNNHLDSVGVDAKHEQELGWARAKLVSGVYIDRTKNDYVSDNLAIVRDPVTGRTASYSVSNSTAPTGVRNYSTDIANDAAFAQLEFSPTADVRLVAGGRYDSITYGFDNHLTPGANFGAPDETRSFARFSPKLGATVALNERNSVYSNISGGFVPPEVSQLYGRRVIPDLRPATYTNVEVGWRAALGDGSVKLDSALYRLEGNDTIVSYTIAPGNSENRNAGQTRSQGLELGLSQATKAWDWRLGWSYAQHQYLSYQASPTLDYSGKTMPQAPQNTLQAQVGYQVLPGARLALELVHQGEYWMNDANTERYAGHTLLNLQGSYAFAGGWQAWLQLRNLSDKAYADSASSSYNGTGAINRDTQNTYSPGAPRSLMLGISKTFGK